MRNVPVSNIKKIVTDAALLLDSQRKKKIIEETHLHRRKKKYELNNRDINNQMYMTRFVLVVCDKEEINFGNILMAIIFNVYRKYYCLIMNNMSD